MYNSSEMLDVIFSGGYVWRTSWGSEDILIYSERKKCFLRGKVVHENGDIYLSGTRTYHMTMDDYLANDWNFSVIFMRRTY